MRFTFELFLGVFLSRIYTDYVRAQLVNRLSSLSLKAFSVKSVGDESVIGSRQVNRSNSSKVEKESRMRVATS